MLVEIEFDSCDCRIFTLYVEKFDFNNNTPHKLLHNLKFNCFITKPYCLCFYFDINLCNERMLTIDKLAYLFETATGLYLCKIYNFV